MQITEIVLQNYRCFGPELCRISLSQLTSFVGANGTGKSAILQALGRLFGQTVYDRAVTKEDFHVPFGEDAGLRTHAEMSIEVRIEFPELRDPKGRAEAVAGFFRQMVVEAPAQVPFCRMRLEAAWDADSTAEGAIDAQLYWLLSADENVPDSLKVPVRAYERSAIQVNYVPALRDPSRLIRNGPASVLQRLLAKVKWSAAVSEGVETASEELLKAFRAEAGVQSLQSDLTDIWRALHVSRLHTDVRFRPLAPDFGQIIRQIEATLGPNFDGSEHGLERLSDGLRSLFYFSLVAAAFHIECGIPVPSPTDVAKQEDTYCFSGWLCNVFSATAFAISIIRSVTLVP